MKDGKGDSGPQRRRAVALRYGGVESTPEVVAKGEGDLADRILAAAREAGIPIEQISRNPQQQNCSGPRGAASPVGATPERARLSAARLHRAASV